jgi:predicted Zn-dependent peptidase
LVALPAPGAHRAGRTKRILADPLAGTVNRTELASGVRVLSERMPGVRSAAIGVAIPVGSRDETVRYAGASHFLEHLLFKGTPTRSALDISAQIEAVGGDLNAFTGKEYTCFHARVLDADVDLAVEVLLDMVLNSLVVAADVDLERDVVLEEIAMSEDDPAGSAMEVFAAQVFAGSPLAAPVIGTVDSISGMSRADVRRHYRRWYVPSNLAIVAAGGIDHRSLVKATTRALAGVDAADAPVHPRRHQQRAHPVTVDADAVTVTKRPFEQANIITGVPGVPKGHEDRYTLAVLNACLGGGMSSRLFQSVREQRGLAYSVHSFSSMYSDAGVLGVYAGCAPAKTEETLAVIADELADVAAHGFSPDEVARGRGQVRGGLALSQEEAQARMIGLAEAELLTGEVRGLSDIIARVDQVTVDDVARLAARLLTQPRQTSIVGPFSDDHATRLEDHL